MDRDTPGWEVIAVKRLLRIIVFALGTLALLHRVTMTTAQAQFNCSFYQVVCCAATIDPPVDYPTCDYCCFSGVQWVPEQATGYGVGNQSSGPTDSVSCGGILPGAQCPPQQTCPTTVPYDKQYTDSTCLSQPGGDCYSSLNCAGGNACVDGKCCVSNYGYSCYYWGGCTSMIGCDGSCLPQCVWDSDCGYDSYCDYGCCAYLG